MIVLIGPRGLGNTQQYERELAFVRQTRDPAFPVVPVILPETTTDPPFDFLRVLTWIDFSHVTRVSDAPDVAIMMARSKVLISAGATDKAGAPYIFHPLRMMLSLTTTEEHFAIRWWSRADGCEMQALALARNLSHHHSLALALVWAAWLHQFRREPQAARGHAEAAIAICSEQGFPLFMSMGAILRGWALVQEGSDEEGGAQNRQGLADLRATGAGLWQPTFLSLIAEADGRIGQAERGLRLLGEGMAMVERNDERFYEAELHRLEGELLLLSNPADPSGAERCFRNALEIAERQTAKSLGLRAALSLARFWTKEGRRSEAHDLLAPIYGWFNEGFGTPDHKAAKTLLDQLPG